MPSLTVRRQSTIGIAESVAKKYAIVKPADSVDTLAKGGKHQANGRRLTGTQISQEDAKKHVLSVMYNHVAKFDFQACEDEDTESFYVADLGEVYRQQQRWKLNLPRVKPHYAVKCNPDVEVLRLLAKMGVNFDCASKGEIKRVLAIGVDPSRIIYANPIKNPVHLRYAASVGVERTVFDGMKELDKIHAFAPNSELFLRISVDDSTALCRLSEKYGANLTDTRGLLEKAKALDLNVVGVSFHCGSGVTDPGTFTQAVQDARTVFDTAREIGYELKTLDVGGGFTGEIFEVVAETLNKALTDNFPPSVRIISEPGRYYVSSAFTMASCIIGLGEEKDPRTNERLSTKAYINDGTYGNYASIPSDHQKPIPQILVKRDPSNAPQIYSIWGRTCDGIDRICPKLELPGALDVGDWVFADNMGAYTKCCVTQFNGFNKEFDVIYEATEPGAAALMRC